MSLTEQILSGWEKAAAEAETRAIGPSGIATLAASVPALVAEVRRLRGERDRLQEREEHFAAVLRVADGGQYRADWDGAIGRVVRGRDAALAALRELALAAESVSDEHGPVEDEECDHCALMWRQLNAAIDRAALLGGDENGGRG